MNNILEFPILIGARNPYGHAVLHRPDKGQEPRDSLGQAVVYDLFPKVGAGGLIAVVLIDCGGRDYIQVREKRCGCRGFMFPDQ